MELSAPGQPDRDKEWFLALAHNHREELATKPVFRAAGDPGGRLREAPVRGILIRHFTCLRR